MDLLCIGMIESRFQNGRDIDKVDTVLSLDITPETIGDHQFILIGIKMKVHREGIVIESKGREEDFGIDPYFNGTQSLGSGRGI